MHTHDIFSIAQIQVTAPHLATKNISKIFLTVASNSDFFAVKRYCDLPVLLKQSIWHY